MAKREAYETKGIEIQTFEARIRAEEILGGRPLSSNVLENWMAILVKKGRLSDKEAENIIGEKEDSAPKDIEDAKIEYTRGFKLIEGRPYIEDRQIKAMFKESFVTLGFMNMMSSVERHKFQTGIIIDPRVILLPENVNIEIQEGPVHVETMRGPRTSIKRSLVAMDVEISFLVRIITGANDKVPDYTEEMLLAALTHASRFVGVGADRSQGMGVFEIKSFEDMGKVPLVKDKA